MHNVLGHPNLPHFLNSVTTTRQGNRILSLRLLKADGASWRSGAINSDRGCRNGEEPASVRSFARSKGSSASNHLPNFSYAIALVAGLFRLAASFAVEYTGVWPHRPAPMPPLTT